jgi:hypothetical protein
MTMKMTEALIRHKALKENLEQLKLRLMKMAKVQEWDMPAERQQKWLAALEADLQDLRQRFLKALVAKALLMQGQCRYDAKACPDGGCSATTYSSRSAIRYLLGTGRHYFEGGLRHVPAIAGSAHSQAPPIPHMGDAGNRSQHT